MRFSMRVFILQTRSREGRQNQKGKFVSAIWKPFQKSVEDHTNLLLGAQLTSRGYMLC